MKRRVLSLVTAVAALTAVGGVTNAADLTVHLALQPFASGLTQPIAMAVRPSDPNIYVAERSGQVVKLTSTGSVVGTVLDISGSGGFADAGTEQGLLGLTFDATTMFVFFTSDVADVVREYAFDGTTASSPVDLLTIPDPEENHNGGNLAFHDGLLYVGTGDGGGAGDQHGRIGNGQNIHVLLGKILRIEPSSTGYTIPAGNPFVGRSGRDEIWDYGLRNPWRWSFDKTTGALWIGDVGQDRFEEIDEQGSGSSGGWNFGWRRMEGNATYPPGSTLPPPAHYHGPVFVYSHATGRCAVIGGYVYRGSAIAGLQGAYLFSDLCDGKIRAFDPARGPRKTQRVLDCPDTDARCVVPGTMDSFGEDANGELYALTLEGNIYELASAGP